MVYIIYIKCPQKFLHNIPTPTGNFLCLHIFSPIHAKLTGIGGNVQTETQTSLDVTLEQLVFTIYLNGMCVFCIVYQASECDNVWK